MKLDIIDKNWTERRWSLKLGDAVKKIYDSKSRGVGLVRYTVAKSTDTQNYHTYVKSLVSELDVSLTPGERGARLHTNCSKGKILFSAGTKYELTSSLYKITDILPQLNPDVSFTSWQFYGQTTVIDNVRLNDAIMDLETEMDLPYEEL